MTDVFYPGFRLSKELLIGAIFIGAALAGCGGGSSLPWAQQGPAVASDVPAGAGASNSRTPGTRGSLDTSPAAYTSAVMADQPLAYYQLADTSSALVDSGSHAISGKYGSSVTLQAKAITAGAASAVAFPGGPSYNPSGFAFTPTNAVLQPAQITLEAWVTLNAPNATNHDLPIALYGTVARGVRYGLYIHGMGNGNNVLLYIQHNAGQPQLALLGWNRLLLGSIYHVVATSDGTNVTTYINGIPERSIAYPGSIDYSTRFVNDGLQIGGGSQIAQYASASFPGTIGQVAVYGSALSQSKIVSHLLAGQLSSTMVTENAVAADAFVDSIGINVHFDNPYTLYTTQFPQVKNLLVASGIRHMRAAMSFTNPTYLANMKDLATSGVYASYLTALTMTQAQVQQFPSLVGTSLEQFEAPNEQDDVGNINWLAQCQAFQQSLYSWVKGDAAIAKFPILGPSLTGKAAQIALGDLSFYMDRGNIHDYFAFFNPGTSGWGGWYPPYGVYGSIAYNMNLGRLQSGTKPIMATETGYGTIASNPLMLDYRTHLRYITRLFFEQFNAGIVRSYVYELLDEGGLSVFNNFGLIDTSLRPKPAYTGIKSLIGALRDPGAPFTPSPFTYQLTGFVADVQHMILQKRNGTYVLAVWLEVPGWVTANNAGGDIIVPNQTVTLSTGNRYSAATLSTMDENGNMSTTPLSWSGQNLSVSVSDKISLINLTP